MGTIIRQSQPYLITLVLTSVTLFVFATVSAEFKFYKSNPNGILRNVDFGKSLTINCTTNDPNAVTSLYHKSEFWDWMELEVQNNKNLIKTGDVYTIKEFGVDEAGWFRCNATNAKKVTILWSDPSTKVTPSEPIESEVTISPVETSIDVGDSVNFTCSAESFHSVKWWRLSNNGLDISISSDQIINETVSSHIIVTLMIKNATTNDSGDYVCIASYDSNDNRQIASLKILEPKIPAIIDYSGKKASVVVRSMENYLQLYCIFKGYPLPKVIWHRNKNEIKVSGCEVTSINSCKNSKHMLFVNNSNINQVTAILTIYKVDYDDRGTYTCKAVNKKGDDIVSIPVDVETGATIDQRSQVILTKLGRTVRLSCNANGNPMPDVFWTRTNSLKVLQRGKGTAKLILREIRKTDLGNYSCNATNFATDIIVFTLKEINPKITKPITASQGLKPGVLIVIIVVIILVFLALTAIGLILYRRKTIHKNQYLLESGIADYQIDPDRSLFEQCRHLPYDNDWEFPEERLLLGETLGTGAFGLVLKAEAIGMGAFKPRDKSPEAKQLRDKIRQQSITKKKQKQQRNSLAFTNQIVAVKSLKDGASKNDYTDLASELKILIHLGEHHNIINILGACTRGRKLRVIIEFAPYGNMLEFLRERRDIYDPNWVKTLNNPDQEFTLVDLVMAAYQISQGMKFLASRKCVHRDLAARNILVGQEYVMKISDFGLARDIYQDDLYVKTSTGLLPIKWMALESLYDRVYTYMSDIWSYGIVLWEIFTLGGTPYPSLPVEELFEFLAKGCRMKQPDYCPVEMYAIMSQCWHHCPEQRPNFAEISERIEQIFAGNVNEETLGYILLRNETAPDHYVEARDGELYSEQVIQGTTNTESVLTNEVTRQKPIASPSNNNQWNSDKGTNGITTEKKPLLKHEGSVSQHESSV